MEKYYYKILFPVVFDKKLIYEIPKLRYITPAMSNIFNVNFWMSRHGKQIIILLTHQRVYSPETDLSQPPTEQIKIMNFIYHLSTPNTRFYTAFKLHGFSSLLFRKCGKAFIYTALIQFNTVTELHIFNIRCEYDLYDFVLFTYLLLVSQSTVLIED